MCCGRRVRVFWVSRIKLDVGLGVVINSNGFFIRNLLIFIGF